MRSGQKTPIAWWSNRGVKSLTKLLVWLLYVAFGHELSTSNEISPNYTLFPPTWEQNKAEDARRMRKINCAAWPTPIANLPWTDAGWLYLSLVRACLSIALTNFPTASLAGFFVIACVWIRCELWILLRFSRPLWIIYICALLVIDTLADHRETDSVKNKHRR